MSDEKTDEETEKEILKKNPDYKKICDDILEGG